MKQKADDTINHYKAHLVAKGFDHESWIDFRRLST
jgi:hypothetical protein